MVISDPESDLNEKRWTAVMPADVEHERESLLFLSRMTYIAFAEYLFNRKIIPAGVFNRRRITDGDVFHTFSSKRRWGAKLSDMMKGIDEAIRAKYAREAIIMVGESEADPLSATEVISITYAYDAADCLKITDEEGKVLISMGYKDKATFRKQVAYMVRKIAITAANLQPFEGEVFPSIKLSYYDERTPADYQPSYFMHCDSTYVFDRTPLKFEFGTVSTNHTAMLFDIRSYYIGDVSALQQTISSGEGVAVTDMNATLEVEVSRMDVSPQISPSSNYRVKGSLSESSDGNDTTNDDYPSPLPAKKQQSLPKKSGAKNSSGKNRVEKKRTVTRGMAMKSRRTLDMSVLQEDNPVDASFAPQIDTLSTADTRRMKSQTFKASVTTRRIGKSPDDLIAYI